MAEEVGKEEAMDGGFHFTITFPSGRVLECKTTLQTSRLTWVTKVCHVSCVVRRVSCVVCCVRECMSACVCACVRVRVRARPRCGLCAISICDPPGSIVCPQTVWCARR